MYDGLSKFCVGLLLTGWIPAVYYSAFNLGVADGEIDIVLSAICLILSYVIGCFWHHAVTENLLSGLVNEDERIVNAYKKVYKRDLPEKFSVSVHPNEYFKAYYHAEKEKMLSVVHVLEAVEAFMRNTLLILPLYAVGMPLFLHHFMHFPCCICQTVFFVLSLLSVAWWFLRNRIQDKIHESVWEADFYLMIISPNQPNPTSGAGPSPQCNTRAANTTI